MSLGMKRNTQARDTYLDATASTPDYISSLASVASPMRERHQDSLLVTKAKVIKGSPSADCSIFFNLKDDYYNAWKEDIAVVNIFFGKETVMGENTELSYEIADF